MTELLPTGLLEPVEVMTDTAGYTDNLTWTSQNQKGIGLSEMIN
jgi:hypothetical protein